MARVILFRGPNTDGILADAVRMGIVSENDEIVIVCRQDDALAKAGDVVRVEPMGGVSWPWTRRNVIIANGGTTEQLVPVLVRFIEAEQSENDNRSWTWEVWDVQKDGKKQLAGDPASDTE